MAQDNAQSQQTDQELQFKKRARRRLVGAVALVLIMVTVLPMVLDDHSKKLPQPEIAITIPSQEQAQLNAKPDNAETKAATAADTIEQAPILDTPSEPLKTQAASVEPAKIEAPALETTLAPPAAVANPPAASTDKPAKGTEKSKDSKATAVKAEASSSKKAPIEKAESVKQASTDKPSADKPSADAVSKTNTEKNTESKASNDKAASEPSHTSYVQIGVFSDEANVKQLQQQLKEAGFKSFTEKLDTAKGVKLRLRAGPFTSRSEASSALDKIKSMGLAGMVVSK